MTGYFIDGSASEPFDIAALYERAFAVTNGPESSSIARASNCQKNLSFD